MLIVLAAVLGLALIYVPGGSFQSIARSLPAPYSVFFQTHGLLRATYTLIVVTTMQTGLYCIMPKTWTLANASGDITYCGIATEFAKSPFVLRPKMISGHKSLADVAQG